ncbi:hypothetical protein FHR70_004625 [Microvirga lupini]|uniref:Secreted protein n=1 Tax=Microvirga lupini TaxID=420324 RepID=A0A7W4VQM2_9HYPH|nr:hypothetical protein [Microvirga lupini]MBB3021524.1 hypothetical protein [Microvirga lupini]
MPRMFLLAALGILTAAAPGWAQDRNGGPVLPDGEIAIPSERTLERDAVTPPRNEFSTNDTIATEQMEKQDRRIDREVEKGICTDC